MRRAIFSSSLDCQATFFAGPIDRDGISFDDDATAVFLVDDVVIPRLVAIALASTSPSSPVSPKVLTLVAAPEKSLPLPCRFASASICLPFVEGSGILPDLRATVLFSGRVFFRVLVLLGASSS